MQSDQLKTKVITRYSAYILRLLSCNTAVYRQFRCLFVIFVASSFCQDTLPNGHFTVIRTDKNYSNVTDFYCEF